MSITFDGTDLVTTTYMTRFVKHESVADRAFSLIPQAREDGSVLISERYGSKIIRLQGIIRASTQADLETAIDTFTELFSRPEKNLDIDWAGSTRRYVATCQKHDFDRDHFHLSVVPWTAEFIVPSGEGKATSTTSPTQADGDILGNGVSTPITLLGSKPPRPTIVLANLSAGSNVRGIEYKSVDSGERLIITYPGSWGNSRTITIDCENRTVTGDVVDGITKALNFYGVFPHFQVGTNNVLLTAGGIVNQTSADTTLSDASTTAIVINSTTLWKTQSFMVPYSDDTFKGITVAAYKTGTPGNITWSIETDNAGKPSGSLVSADATGTISAVDMTTSLSYVTDYSTNPFSLSANTVYWLVFKAAATLDGTNLYTFGLPKTNTYARGKARYSNDSGATWTDFTNKTDMMFRILFGGSEASVAPTHTITYYKTYL